MGFSWLWLLLCTCVPGATQALGPVGLGGTVSTPDCGVLHVCVWEAGAAIEAAGPLWAAVSVGPPQLAPCAPDQNLACIKSLEL